MKIHCSAECKAILDEVGGYEVPERGIVAMKGKGSLLTYWLVDQDPSYKRFKPRSEDVDQAVEDTESLSEKHKMKKSPGKSYLRTPLGSTYMAPSTSTPNTGMKSSRSVQDISSSNLREDAQLRRDSDVVTRRRNSDISRTELPKNGKNGYTLLPMDCDDSLPCSKSEEVEIRTTDFGDGSGDCSSQARSVSACSLNRCEVLVGEEATMNGAVSQRSRNNSQGSKTKTKKNSTTDSGIGSNGNSSRDCNMHNEIFLWDSARLFLLIVMVPIILNMRTTENVDGYTNEPYEVYGHRLQYRLRLGQKKNNRRKRWNPFTFMNRKDY